MLTSLYRLVGRQGSLTDFPISSPICFSGFKDTHDRALLFRPGPARFHRGPDPSAGTKHALHHRPLWLAGPSNVFQHLAVLYSPLYIPASVRREVIGIGAAELAGAVGNWVTEVSPGPAAVRPFVALRSIADRDVLAVARELSVAHVLSDDRVVRRWGIIFYWLARLVRLGGKCYRALRRLIPHD